MAAATLWQTVFACELALAMLVGLTVTTTIGRPIGAALSITAGVLVLLHFALVTTTAITSRALARPPRPRTDVVAMLTALLSETFHSALAVLAMSIEPWLREREPKHVTPVPRRVKPVVLVHGFACNRAVWRVLAPRLRSTGAYCVHTVNLDPPWGDLDRLTEHLEREVLKIHREHSGAPVLLVGHSIGGLLARALQKRSKPRVIRKVITIATPHPGADLARWIPLPAGRQIQPGSPWLAKLNQPSSPEGALPVADLYSREDNLLPAANDDLALVGHAGIGTAHELRALGHFGLLAAPAAIGLILRLLQESE